MTKAAQGFTGDGRDEKGASVYAVIQRYEGADHSRVEEGVRRIQSGLVPILKSVPGFVGYQVIDAGGGVIASVGFFGDQAGTEEAARKAADWVGQNLANMGQNAPQVTIGRIVILEGTPLPA